MLLILRDSTGHDLVTLTNSEIPNPRNAYFIDELTKMINIKSNLEIDTEWVSSLWQSREEENGTIILQAQCMCRRA